MRVEYESTLRDLTQHNLRSLMSKRVNQWHRIKLGLFCTLIGAGVWLGRSDQTIREGLPGAAVTGVLGGCVGLFIYSYLVRKSVAQQISARLGGEGPYRIAEEITPKGITCRMGAQQTQADWSAIEQIVELPRGVELRKKDGGTILVRRRGFTSEHQVMEFVELARQYLRAAEV